MSVWNSMSDLVDETVSELEVLCKQYPCSSFADFFDTDELHDRVAIRESEKVVIAECARYFKAHPKELERWANYKK